MNHKSLLKDVLNHYYWNHY